MHRRELLFNLTAIGVAQKVLAAEGPRVRVGMLGTGHSHFMGKLQALRGNPAFEVVVVAESNAAAKAKLQADPKLTGLRWVSEAEMLSDKSIHLVVVECRAWEAVPWGKKVIAAGKHLHLEKPPGNSYAAFKELVEEARGKKLLLQTGYLWRWHEGVAAGIEAAKKGWLGEVFMVRGTMNSDRGQEERDIEAKYAGGGLFELSGHVIDRMVELLGRPKNVKSWLRHDTSVPDKLADNNLAVLEFDRALGVVTQSAKMGGSGDHRSFEILGTEGSVVLNPEANPPRMRVFMKQARGPYQAGWQDVPLAPQPRFVPDFAELAKAIQSGQQLRQSYDHELLLQETLLRASGEMK